MRKVERTPEGSYRVRFRHGISPKTGRPKQTAETFPGTVAGKRQAEQFAKWLDALGPQGALDQLYAAEQQADIPSLDALAVDHVDHLTGITDGTRKNYLRLWNRTWSPLIGRLPANQITRDDIARAVNSLSAKYSGKSLQNQRGLLAAVLDRAVELAYLPKNPAHKMRLPRGREAERVEMRLITPDEYAGIIERIPEHYRPFIVFLAGTGCRWGEAVALTVADVQLPNVRIRRALNWSPDNVRTVGATKTKKGNRTVACGEVVQAALREQCAGKAKADLVFTAPRGGPILHRTFWSRVWLPAVQHLAPRPRIHDLRHSHASWLLAGGAPIHVVQVRLGHESIKTTVDTYGHLMPDAQLAAASAAELVFNSRALTIS